MIMLERTTKYRCNSEEAAKMEIENFRADAKEKGYLIKKIGYEYKNKKAKGEIIDEAWVLSVTAVYANLWEI